jgi:hypothetical protein
LFTEAEAVSAEAVFDGITERSSSDGFDDRAVAEAHLEQPPAGVAIAADR